MLTHSSHAAISDLTPFGAQVSVVVPEARLGASTTIPAYTPSQISPFHLGQPWAPMSSWLHN